MEFKTKQKLGAETGDISLKRLFGPFTHGLLGHVTYPQSEGGAS